MGRNRKPVVGRSKLTVAYCGIIYMVAAPFLVDGPSAAGSAADLVPHRAQYEFTLESIKSGSGVGNVDGLMVADWSQSCDGWTLDHRSLFDISYSTGTVARITANVATWESRDGLSYHFSVRNAVDGNDTERIEGRATLTASGRSGYVEYTHPAAERMRLPVGTVFPITHSRRVLLAAKRAPTIVTMPVFDGLSEKGADEVSAVIGLPIHSATAGLPAQFPTLEERMSWPLRLAYFPAGSRAAKPDHEIGMRMFDNGIAADLILDFGDFKLRAVLTKLELGERPSCRP